MGDAYSDGWNGATYSFVDADGITWASGDLDNAALGDGLSTGSDSSFWTQRMPMGLHRPVCMQP